MQKTVSQAFQDLEEIVGVMFTLLPGLKALKVCVFNIF